MAILLAPFLASSLIPSPTFPYPVFVRRTLFILLSSSPIFLSILLTHATERQVDQAAV